MSNYVEIDFDCLPLRSITRLDIPIDASPKYRARCERLKEALQHHGSHNTYYLYNARCVFHLTNDPNLGMIEFKFEGTVLTDDTDLKTKDCVLSVELVRETCDWLNEKIVKWFHETVPEAVQVEFDRYIAAGDLAQTKKRIEKIQQQENELGGYVGMGL